MGFGFERLKLFLSIHVTLFLDSNSVISVVFYERNNAPKTKNKYVFSSKVYLQRLGLGLNNVTVAIWFLFVSRVM